MSISPDMPDVLEYNSPLQGAISTDVKWANPAWSGDGTVLTRAGHQLRRRQLDDDHNSADGDTIEIENNQIVQELILIQMRPKNACQHSNFRYQCIYMSYRLNKRRSHCYATSTIHFLCFT